MKKILLISAIISLALLVGCSGSTDLQSVTNSGQIEIIGEQSYDWQDINIKGGNVEHVFKLKNSGENDLVLKGVVTSCMCTTATYQFADNKISPEFGMHNNATSWTQAISPGEIFELKAVFDPMAHGPTATGPITRQIQLFTSSIDNPELELKLIGNVLSEEEYLSKNGEEGHEHEEDIAKYEISNANVAKKIKNNEGFTLIDVREDYELEETGVIAGAIHIPLDQLSIDNLEKAGISKTDEIILYCRSGNRSRQAYEILNVFGYTNTQSMAGGIVHWEEDGLQLEKWNGESAVNLEALNNEMEINGAKIVFDREEEDFGIVSPYATQETIFVISNKGTETLEIGTITTSCACTSAEIESKSIKAGASTNLKVIFDPTVHEEPVEEFKRTVFLVTNDPNMPEAEVNILVDIDENLME